VEFQTPVDLRKMLLNVQKRVNDAVYIQTKMFRFFTQFPSVPYILDRTIAISGFSSTPPFRIIMGILNQNFQHLPFGGRHEL
jgi:hypothetical protein